MTAAEAKEYGIVDEVLEPTTSWPELTMRPVATERQEEVTGAFAVEWGRCGYQARPRSRCRFTINANR